MNNEEIFSNDPKLLVSNLCNISDWNIVDEKMLNLKYPLVFLINILKFQRKIDDYLLSILVRFYLKNNFELCFNLPIFLIFNHLDSKFEITKKVINDFYTSLSKKIFFIKSIIDFRNICNGAYWFDNVFNNSIINKRNKIDEVFCLAQLKSSFSIYDYKKNPIIQELKDRFNRLDSFFGKKIFDEKKIIIISEKEFDKISNEDKIKYVLYFYLKVEKFFNKILYVYDVFIFEDNKLKQILNPRPIIVNLDSEQNERSDTDDLELLI